MKIRIRSKLAAALALPLVALVAISGYEAVQASTTASDVRAETELATVSIGPSSLTSELQNERNYTALDLIGLAEAATLEVSSVAEARERVDTAISDLRQFLEGRGEIVATAFAPAFDAIESDLDASRQVWDDNEAPKDLANQPVADDVFERFTSITTEFFAATESIATSVDDATLRNGIEIVENSNRRGELLANITRLIVLDTLTEGNEADYQSDVAVRVDRITAADSRIEQLSDGMYERVVAETMGRDFDVEAIAIFETYLDGEPVDIPALLAAVSGGASDEITSSAEMASQILADRATELTAEADDRAELFQLLAVGVVAIALLGSWLASRSITRPLRKLRSEAHAMASERLPSALQQILETPLGDDVVIPDLDRIEVKTRDEVREIVEVLNEVQERTLALAADQAVLRRNIADSFVNLGRRNQNLLDRQLDFITELEQNETEPEELESLFRLDHLATRMRRNAESLLVLAGVESPRQWTASVAVDDAIRAALGEVEEYQRVNVRSLDDAMVLGSTAAGLSHVLAELIENGLQYSPPGSEVEIKGRLNSSGYVIAISDDGIGMEADDIGHANRRLSGQESYTVAPSRYLGHYVAGNLSTRLGLEVRLRDNPAGGVTAIVAIPLELLESIADPAPAIPSEAGLIDTPVDAADVDDAGAAVPVSVPLDAPVEFEEIIDLEPAESGDDTAPSWTPVREADPMPETLAQALGADRLADIVSADDLTSAIDGDPPSGLPKRVPGAQRPDLAPTIARRPPMPHSTPAPERSTQPSKGAFGFLSGYASAKSASDTETTGTGAVDVADSEITTEETR